MPGTGQLCPFHSSPKGLHLISGDNYFENPGGSVSRPTWLTCLHFRPLNSKNSCLYFCFCLFLMAFTLNEAWWPSGLSRLLSGQRRFESGRRQTVTVTACTLWQDSINLSATSSMTTLDAETDVKFNIYLFIYVSH